MCRLQSCLSSGLVLIFVNSKADTEDVASRLQQHFRDLRGHQLQVGGAEGGVEVCCLHGGKQQGERSEIIRRFKSGACQVLVATDVASRGKPNYQYFFFNFYIKISRCKCFHTEQLMTAVIIV